MRNNWRSAALWALAIVGAIAIGLIYRIWFPNPVDLEVYRAGGTMLLDGTDLYGARDGLPFTYAPFAALVFVPLAAIPWPAAVVALTAISVLALGRALWLLLANLWDNQSHLARFLVVMVAALLTEPMISTITFGQVNAILLWLVMEDVFGRRTSRIGGVLTGIAAGIKLTPGIFLLMYLVVGSIRRFVLGVLAFAVTVVIAWPFVGNAVVDFWTDVTWQVSRIGNPEFSTNQSLNGTLWRLAGPEPSRVIWLLAALVAVAAAMWVARLQWQTNRLMAVAATGLAMLLASPISWSHHWVWAFPAFVALLQIARAKIFARLWIGVGLVIMVFWIPMLPPSGGQAEFDWNPWQILLGNSYVIWAVVSLAYLTVLAVQHRLPKSRKLVSETSATAASG
ncbi:glycosyltransferase 87 family protein [Candidatus Nanopelagicales bacterium]|nr:glycosyltransferase 87 family protein [Candidatus Nanopelagicales bacterium]